MHRLIPVSRLVELLTFDIGLNVKVVEDVVSIALLLVVSIDFILDIGFVHRLGALGSSK
ncbi:unnamed protein product [Schistosoma margrebowiei]|uniref:Uncharacterized protein n=1 Tax=Schistosoma margrebowiei TaxID=48269 RepID=A0A3P7ZUU8_9TREM|nr:unnamed protein product [Schistosoma margrebowiei]